MAGYIDKYVSPSFSMRDKSNPVHNGNIGMITSGAAYLINAFLIKIKEEDGFSTNISDSAFRRFVNKFKDFDHKLIKPYEDDYYDERVRFFDFEQGGFNLENVVHKSMCLDLFLSEKVIRKVVHELYNKDEDALDERVRKAKLFQRAALRNLNDKYNKELNKSFKLCASGWHSSRLETSKGYNFSVRGASDVVSAVKDYFVK